MSTTNCKRCGRSFEPELLEAINAMSNCCRVCSVRNIFDGLGLPTPPDLLDWHSKIPTLSDEEYRKKMAGVKSETLPEELYL